MTYQIIDIRTIPKEQIEYYFCLMSDKKKDRINRYQSAADKTRSIAGEMLARQMIASHCRIKEESLRFEPGQNGKPFVTNADIFFSISHSGDYVLCALSDKEIGADIEKTRVLRAPLPLHFFSKEENKYILDKDISESERQTRFFKVWTFKEAYLKKYACTLADISKPNYFTYTETVQHFARDGYMICIIH